MNYSWNHKIEASPDSLQNKKLLGLEEMMKSLAPTLEEHICKTGIFRVDVNLKYISILSVAFWKNYFRRNK